MRNCRIFSNNLQFRADTTSNNCFVSLQIFLPRTQRVLHAATICTPAAAAALLLRRPEPALRVLLRQLLGVQVAVRRVLLEAVPARGAGVLGVLVGPAGGADQVTVAALEDLEEQSGQRY